MPKNILIFSDGTGQSGGVRPDQRLSNVYKLFRATRVGPDNEIDPAQQIAFYDPGLGTTEDAGNLRLKIASSIRKFASSATGAGLGQNVVDCYEAIVKHYEPGDRVFLFGFSRGAYTARCVGGVLALCGVPTRMPDGDPVPRHGSALRAIASEAVHKVYEHGSGRDRTTYRPERLELARRFRAKYSSDMDGHANVAPYWIGVFDTVAALGASGLRRLLMLAALLAAVGAAGVGAAALLAWLFGWPFWTTALAITGAAALFALLKVARARLRVIRDYPTVGKWRWHWSGWRFKFYDTNLDARVRFARHALAIDETRSDFQRVPWGQPSEGNALVFPGEPERFRQWWFAGNHSDIGGSYPEDESRLSDIALRWMVEEAVSLPDPILVDEGKLRIYPSATGMQHCEVEGLRDSYPSWMPRKLRRTWKVKPRMEASGAPYHPTVLERIALPAISNCGRSEPYRPLALSKDPTLAHYYGGAVPETGAAE